jgi:hypothetical protein
LSSRSKCRDISYEKRDIPHPTQSTRQKTFRLQRKSKILRNSARLTDESQNSSTRALSICKSPFCVRGMPFILPDRPNHSGSLRGLALVRVLVQDERSVIDWMPSSTPRNGVQRMLRHYDRPSPLRSVRLYGCPWLMGIRCKSFSFESRLIRGWIGMIRSRVSRYREIVSLSARFGRIGRKILVFS